VPEVAQEPPQACCAAGHPLVVGNDEQAGADPRRRGSGGEVFRAWKRVSASLCPARGRGKLALDVEERRTRDVPREVELPPAVGLAELPAAVDELVAQARSLESVTG
jgi:hypothetical protein